MNEAEFQEAVVKLAELYGWRHYHTWDSRRSVGGFPDLVLVRGPELLFVELKSETGQVRQDQVDWLEAIGAVDTAVCAVVRAAALEIPVPPAVEAHIWRPSNFDFVHERLKR